MNNHRNNRLLLLAGMALILVILSLVVSGCSLTLLRVSGTVYEWVDAPADTDGEVYVDMAAPTDRIIEPVASVSIASFGGAVTTSENGTFAKRWGVPPGRLRMVDVKIEKEGYHAIKGMVALQALKEHSFVIFLVRQ